MGVRDAIVPSEMDMVVEKMHFAIEQTFPWKRERENVCCRIKLHLFRMLF